jgi:hypothetical protein
MNLYIIELVNECLYYLVVDFIKLLLIIVIFKNFDDISDNLD